MVEFQITLKQDLNGLAPQHTAIDTKNQIHKLILHTKKLEKNSKVILVSNVNMVKILYILETTYRNNYLGEKKDVCPAKTRLESKVKGMFTHSKAKFSENTDFKALSP